MREISRKGLKTASYPKISWAPRNRFRQRNQPESEIRVGCIVGERRRRTHKRAAHDVTSQNAFNVSVSSVVCVPPASLCAQGHAYGHTEQKPTSTTHLRTWNLERRTMASDGARQFKAGIKKEH